MFRAATISILAAPSSKSNLMILNFTKQSSTPMLAYRRFTLNLVHSFFWFAFKITPGSRSWESFDVIRSVHNHINRRLDKVGEQKISQKDMALTQFLYIGFQIVYQDEMGVHGSVEQFEAYNHALRLMGFMLGIEDRFNVCGESVAETRGRCLAIIEDIFEPAMREMSEEYLSFLKTAVNGVRCSVPFLHFESLIFFLKRYTKVTGHQCMRLTHGSCSGRCQFDHLSWYSKMRVKLDVIFIEYLTKFTIYRVILNLFYGLIVGTLIALLPIPAMIRFGWKNAYVRSSKRKDAKSMSQKL
jgi:hypothetical protein